MEIISIINGCRHICPFWANSMDGMYCNHPYWDDKPAYDSMIISQDNSNDGNIPNECPLRKEDLTINYKLVFINKESC